MPPTALDSLPLTVASHPAHHARRRRREFFTYRTPQPAYVTSRPDCLTAHARNQVGPHATFQGRPPINDT